MAGSSRSVLIALGISLLGLPGLSAQARVAGRVARVAGGDTLPVGNTAVALHRVGRAAQGPIDTVRSDSRGRFTLRFTADTTAAYLLSVRHHGIEYFSQPVARNPGAPDTAVVLIVSDTSSAAEVSAGERTILIGKPDESGTRVVVDWFQLLNTGERTRVSPDASRPSWGAPLPPDAQNIELAEARLSQFSPDAVEFRGDSVVVFAPLSPGQKELVLQYRIPGALRSFEVPGAAGTDSLFVLLEEPGARIVAPALALLDTQQLEGRPFRRFAGRMAGATALTVAFPPAPLSPALVLAVLLVLTAGGFAVGAGLLLTRRRMPVAVHPVYLADAIARLDAARIAQGNSGSADAEERYRAERARRLAELARALAGDSPRS